MLPPGVPSVSPRVRAHLDLHPGLITVNHQPQGPVAYQVIPDDELKVQAISVENGVTTVHAFSEYGEAFFVLNQGVVTEILLHTSAEQAAAYREFAAAVAGDHQGLADEPEDDS